MSTPLRLGASFVFAGTVRTESGKRQVVPGTLVPVRNTLLFTRPAHAAKDAEPAAWTTDAKGLLYPADKDGQKRATAAHYLGKDCRFLLPPPEVLLEAWVGDPEKWAENVKELVKKAGSQGVALQEQPITKKLLKAPERPPAEGDETEYAAWYDKLGDGAPLSGFVLPRVRALLIVLHDRALANSELTVTPPEGPPLPVKVRVSGEVVYALVVGEETKLKAGLYTVKVPMAGRGAWSDGVRKQRAYTLKEQVRFPLSTLAGDFDVLTCGPLSVEEAVMTQFAGFYAHLAAAAKKKAMFPELEDREFPEVPKALDAWAEQLKWLHAKANLPVKLVNAEGHDQTTTLRSPAKEGEGGLSGRTKLLMGLVYKQLSFEDPTLSAAKDTFDLAMSLKEVGETLSDFKKERAAEKQIEGLRKLLWKDLDPWNRYRWWKFFKKTALDGGETGAHLLKLAEANAVARAGILRVGIPEKSTNLHKLLGERAGSAVPKVLAAAEFGVQALETASAIAQLMEKGEKLVTLKQDFASLVRQLDEDLKRGACREAIGNLERMRTATVAAHLDVDEQEKQALLAAIDLVLAGLTAVGVGGAGLALVVWGKGLVTDLAGWFERVALKGAVSNFYTHRLKLIAEQTRASHANQKMLHEVFPGGADGGASDMHVQFRLRAEALNGLQGLLLRAASSAKSDDEYLANVKKYRVREYIENYLLGDGWQMPLRPVVPIGLDAAWLHFAGPHSPWVNSTELVSQLGLDSPLKAAAVTALPGALATLVAVNEVLAGNAKAQFHDTFPIHQLASDFDTFATAFRPAWPELGPAHVDVTRVHWRPSGYTSPKAWQPVNPCGDDDADDLPLRSPLDQIRVLVVLEDDHQVQSRPGAAVGPGKSAQMQTYPISLQLWRYDGSNVSGPVYRDITRRLKAEDLLEDEQHLAGRLGCVFYPFFQFGPQLVPGTKPLAGPLLQGEDVGMYRFLGLLTDMRYGFEVKLGRSDRGIPVKLGSYPGKPDSDLDEYRVSIGTGKEEKKLLVSSFLRSRSETSPLPRLFRWQESAVPSYVRVGGGRYTLADAEPDQTVRFPSFNWRDPVEFIVVVAATVLNEHLYAQQGLDWTRLPITMDLENYVLKDTTGPSYASQLEFVGHLMPSSRVLVPARKPPERAVSEWAKQVSASPASLDALARAIHPPGLLSSGMAPRYHVFAAHFRLSYVTPRDPHGAPSRLVESLRPWGMLIRRDGYEPYYRIGLRNLRTPDESGLSVGALDTEFHFRGPESFLLGVPWQGVSAQRMARWIREEGTRRNPEAELIRR